MTAAAATQPAASKLLPMPGVGLNAPHSVDAEKAVLGGVLIDPGAFGNASDLLKADDFYLTRHAHIWRAMEALVSEGQSIDILLLAERLERDVVNGRTLLEDIGGRAYLLDLSNSTPTSVHTSHYAEVVSRESIRRQVLKACDDTRAEALNDQMDLETLTGRYESRFGAITLRSSRGGLEQIGDAVTRETDRLEAAMDNPNPGRYFVPSPWKALNHNAYGWTFGKLAYVGSYMHGGKTTILMQSAIAACLAGVASAFFSVEGTTEEVTRDLLAMHSGLRAADVLTGNLTKAEYLHYLKRGDEMSRWPLYVDGDKLLDPRTMYMRLKRLQATLNGAPLIVFVDYLGKLMLPPVPKDARQDTKTDAMLRTAQRDDRLRYQYLSGAMKTTAVDLNVAMVVAAQNGRPDKPAPARSRKKAEKPAPPNASELAGSAALERDADLILMPQFIKRDAGEAELHVVKNKVNGWNGSFPVLWDKRRIFLDYTRVTGADADEHWSDGR